MNTYKTPAMLCVELIPIAMMAQSEEEIVGFKENAKRGSSGDEIDVKAVSSGTVWDNEW